MKTPRPRSTEPGAALPDTMVRVVLPPPLCVAGPRSTSWRRPPRAAGHVPRLRYAAAASLTSGSSPAEWICRSMRRMRRCRRRYHRATSRFRWWGRWLGGEGDPDGVVQPSPGTPSLPNSSTGSSSACSPPPAACSSRRLIGRELEHCCSRSAAVWRTSERSAWGDASALGLTVGEYQPAGCAAAELRRVVEWLTLLVAQPQLPEASDVEVRT